MGSWVEVEAVEVVRERETLLEPVSFSAEPGQSIAIAGPNGSGKTTLLKVLAGLVRPTGGTASVAGLPVEERDPRFRRAVAALVGLPPLARDLTLAEQLAMVAATWGSGATEAHTLADARLRELDIAELARRYPHELSSGQLQLFSLALTLARPLEVLLLDEPEQRLDADRLDAVAAVLARHVESGRTLVFASHSPVLMEAIADRTVVLAPSGNAPTRGDGEGEGR